MSLIEGAQRVLQGLTGVLEVLDLQHLIPEGRLYVGGGIYGGQTSPQVARGVASVENVQSSFYRGQARAVCRPAPVPIAAFCCQMTPPEGAGLEDSTRLTLEPKSLTSPMDLRYSYCRPTSTKAWTFSRGVRRQSSDMMILAPAATAFS